MSMANEQEGFDWVEKCIAIPKAVLMAVDNSLRKHPEFDQEYSTALRGSSRMAASIGL
jgi:hypothetical protein